MACNVVVLVCLKLLLYCALGACRQQNQVPESFIRESMNLIDIGRGAEIPYYKEALGVLLGET